MDRMVGYCPGQLGSCEMAVGRLLAPTPYGGSSNQCKRSALTGHSDQTCLDRLLSLEQVSGIEEPVLPLSVWLSRYHCCYGVEPHKRKQPCTESADPQHTCTLGSKNRIHLFGGFEFYEC
ncbi:hypothetical protein T01_1190 [Trichinella spiralis]|uniref:Uncharacterized protein n=1 Tax=Trichinella spiralis TaxID=6334 RepID=A0A0V1BS07_TRISP|nr:hypothetical protein T01_1190 [Trichinella spiralis]